MKRNYLVSRAIRGTIVVGALATALSASIAFADQDNPGKGRANRANAVASARSDASLAHRHAVKGVVKDGSINTGNKTFTIVTKWGDLKVTTNNETKFHTRGEESFGFGDLKKDMVVMVQGERPADDTILARNIIAHLAKPKRERDVQRQDRTVTTGLVSEIKLDNGVVTGFNVTPSGGTAVTFKVNAETEYTLKGIDEFSDANSKT
ncbi:MAG TPA: hypothetical protein VGW38_27095, partial [Chloroflexota bacterium]|nr:hypothetical protein [Chloroflexota bacterium]